MKLISYSVRRLRGPISHFARWESARRRILLLTEVDVARALEPSGSQKSRFLLAIRSYHHRLRYIQGRVTPLRLLTEMVLVPGST